jgi:hypothetical protein
VYSLAIVTTAAHALGGSLCARFGGQQRVNHGVVSQRNLPHVLVPALSIVGIVKVDWLKGFHGRKPTGFVLKINVHVGTVRFGLDAVVHERQVFVQVVNFAPGLIMNGVRVRFVLEARRVEFGKEIVQVKGNLGRGIVRDTAPRFLHKRLRPAPVAKVGWSPRGISIVRNIVDYGKIAIAAIAMGLTVPSTHARCRWMQVRIGNPFNAMSKNGIGTIPMSMRRDAFGTRFKDLRGRGNAHVVVMTMVPFVVECGDAVAALQRQHKIATERFVHIGHDADIVARHAQIQPTEHDIPALLIFPNQVAAPLVFIDVQSHLNGRNWYSKQVCQDGCVTQSSHTARRKVLRPIALDVDNARKETVSFGANHFQDFPRFRGNIGAQE